LRLLNGPRSAAAEHALVNAAAVPHGAGGGLRPSLDHRREEMNEMRLFDPFAIDPIDDVFRGMMRPWRYETVEAPPRIRLDLAEMDGTYTVRAEIPGARKEDIDVRIEGNLVTISAEMKKEWEEKKEGRVLRSERHYGRASRSFTLASPVDESKADAKYENGILELTLPKKSAAATRRLAVH
jgi:HSP20 family protein